MLKKFDSILARIMEVIMTVSLLLTVTVTFIQVLFRYILGMPLPWAQEFLMLCFVYSIFSGAAVLVYKNEHLTVDLFDNLGKGMDKALKVLESVVAIFVLVVFVYFGMDLVNQNFATGQTLGLLPVQRAYLYMAIPVSAAVMIYFYIRRFFSIWSG